MSITAHRQPTARQVAFLAEYDLEPTDDFEVARQRIGAFLAANPEIAEQRRESRRARETAPPSLRVATTAGDHAPSAERRRTTAVQRYLAASRARAEAKGVKPATERQVRHLLRLAYAKGRTDSQRINTLSALAGGVTMRRASVLIAQLDGTFAERIAA